MEEILASIRRIIADDQTMPSRTSPREHPPLIEAARVEDAPPQSPIPLRRGEPAPPDRAWPNVREKAGAAERPSTGEPRPEEVEPPAVARLAPIVPAHGQIAPQFPMPDRPPAADAASSQDPGYARLFPSVVDVEAGRGGGEASALENAAAAPSAAFTGGHGITAEDAPRRAAGPDLFSVHTDQTVSSAFNMLAATRLADNSEELLGLAREMIRPLLKSWLDDNLPTMVERLVRAEIERVARGGR